MDGWIDGWMDKTMCLSLYLDHSSQCSMTGVTKAMACVILSMG